MSLPFSWLYAKAINYVISGTSEPGGICVEGMRETEYNILAFLNHTCWGGHPFAPTFPFKLECPGECSTVSRSGQTRMRYYHARMTS